MRRIGLGGIAPGTAGLPEGEPELNFFVPGLPVPGGSKRGFIYTPKGGGKPRVAMSDDSGARGKSWRAVVQLAAKEAHPGPPLSCPLRLSVAFFLPRPKGHLRANGDPKPSAPRFPTTRPDATKLWRAVEDSCTGIIWTDDAIIVRQVVSKEYAATIGVRIAVSIL